MKKLGHKLMNTEATFGFCLLCYPKYPQNHVSRFKVEFSMNLYIVDFHVVNGYHLNASSMLLMDLRGKVSSRGRIKILTSIDL